MKHILSTVTVLFILLTSSVSWGSLDGKGVFCDNGEVGEKNITHFVSFNGGGLDLYGIQKTTDDQFESYVTNIIKLNYTSTADEISWYSLSHTYTLYRKTLMISVIRGDIRLPTIQCEVHTSEKIFSLLKSRVEERQIEFEKGIVGNKI
jgi:hypothetical protein